MCLSHVDKSSSASSCYVGVFQMIPAANQAGISPQAQLSFMLVTAKREHL